MPDSYNYGISATNVIAQNIAVGPHARIEVPADAPMLDARLAALLEAIQAFDGAPAAQRELAAAGQEVARTLEEPKPDKPRLLARLDWLGSAAGSAGAIATAAAALAAIL